MNNDLLYGLVMCGGQSFRMGIDKAFIDYHGQAQIYHVHGMLLKFCTEVFVSCNDRQITLINDDVNKIADDIKYKNTGPAGGLLTAFSIHPDKNFLVLACDYPFFTSGELSAFIHSLEKETFAASFYNEKAGLYEPLLAYYSAAAGKQLLHSYQQYSMQKFLQFHDASKYYAHDPLSIKSIDTPQQLADAREQLSIFHSS